MRQGTPKKEGNMFLFTVLICVHKMVVEHCCYGNASFDLQPSLWGSGWGVVIAHPHPCSTVFPSVGHRRCHRLHLCSDSSDGRHEAMWKLEMNKCFNELMLRSNSMWEDGGHFRGGFKIYNVVCALMFSLSGDN